MNRRWHRRIAVITLVPVFIIVGTGLVLQLRHWMPTIQPENQKSPSGPFVDGAPLITFERILEVARADEVAAVKTWDDIKAIDVRPVLGVARLRTAAHHELQIDLFSGAILSSAPRYTNLLVQIHEGAFFGSSVRTFVFLPTGFGLLFLAVSGVVLIYRYYTKKSRRRPA